MNFTKEQLLAINELTQYIVDFDNYFGDYKDEFVFTDERVKEIIDNNEDSDRADQFT